MARFGCGGGLGIGCGAALVVAGLVGIAVGNTLPSETPKNDPGFAALFLLPLVLLKGGLPYVAWPMVAIGAVLAVMGVLSLARK